MESRIEATRYHGWALAGWNRAGQERDQGWAGAGHDEWGQGGERLTLWLLSPYFLHSVDAISNAEVRQAPPILFIDAALASSTFQPRSPREIAYM